MHDAVVICPVENGKNIVPRKKCEPSTFENAIIETKFGKFNYLLILSIFPGALCGPFESGLMSYVFGVAQCDLNLTLSHRGLLISITFAGMTTGALIWGYLFDTLGRRRLISMGLLAEGFVLILCSFSQNITFLLIFKFLGGFLVVGPTGAISSYLSEFHSSKYRPRIQMIIGTFVNSGFVILPIIGWLILPREINYSLMENNINLHSWNFFILACSLAPLLCGVFLLFMPESPKFLMTCGRNRQALEVLRKVYSYNTGQPEHTYPVKVLIDEVTENNKNGNKGKMTANRTKKQALIEGFKQLKPLFFKPYMSKIVLVSVMFGFCAMSMTMLRFWLPQIYQAMADYNHLHNGTTASLCTMIGSMVPSNITTQECIVNKDNQSVYTNSIINGFSGMVSLFAAGSIINRFGKKKILFGFAMMSGIWAISLYFSRSTVATVILSSLFLSFGTVPANVLISVCVDLFPTTLRTTTISISGMVARIGMMVGNFIFPFLLESGCEPPFFVVGGAIMVCALLSILLPNTDSKPMQ